MRFVYHDRARNMRSNRVAYWSVELVIVRLLQLVPTAVPALVMAPVWTLVQWPPALPVMVVSAMVRVPP